MCYVSTCYVSTCHVDTCFVDTCYVPCGYMLRTTWVHVTCYVLRVRATWVRVTYYAVRDTWISLHYFPPLVSFEGLFACRKWFDFLELEIKNDWGFGFRYGNFSGKEISEVFKGGFIFGVYNNKVSWVYI